MLAISIKNSILILLIVLILHFLIKNALMDKQPTIFAKKPEQRIEMFSNVPKPVADIKSEPKPLEKKECEVLPERNTQDEKNELLKYVFGDDAKDCDEEINKYFQGIGSSASLGDSNGGCILPRTDANSLPLSTTCDPNITTFPRDTKKQSEKCVKQEVAQGMMLHEYENENQMSGGLFGGLNAFDEFASSFSEYAPCA